jgi:transcriptional regulator with XRE-family HTH domain
VPKPRPLNPFKAARLAAGFHRQKDVAATAGIAQSVISALEHGKNHNPTWDVLSKLCQLYHVRPDDLLPPAKLPRRNHRQES